MTKKKVVIPQTPNRGNLIEALDNWVVGENVSNNSEILKISEKEKPIISRTTFQIPTSLYKKLKKTALIEDKTITEKLTEILEKTLPDV